MSSSRVTKIPLVWGVTVAVGQAEAGYLLPIIVHGFC